MHDQRSTPALEAGRGKRVTAPTLDELRDQVEAVRAEIDVLAAMFAARAEIGVLTAMFAAHA